MIKKILAKYFGYKYWYCVKLEYLCNGKLKFHNILQYGVNCQKNILDNDSTIKFLLSNTNSAEFATDDYVMRDWNIEITSYLGFFLKT